MSWNTTICCSRSNAKMVKTFVFGIEKTRSSQLVLGSQPNHRTAGYSSNQAQKHSSIVVFETCPSIEFDDIVFITYLLNEWVLVVDVDDRVDTPNSSGVVSGVTQRHSFVRRWRVGK